MDEGADQKLDAICDEFESALKAGESPKIEDFLTRVSSDQQAELLQELMKLELWWKRNEDESPNRELYLQRFPKFEQEIKGVWDEYEVSTHIGPNKQTNELQNSPLKQIGPYKLLQEIGQGGIGTVYMAEQSEPVRRRVALKLIRSGSDLLMILLIATTIILKIAQQEI